MGLLSFFKKKKPQTANLAKERLKIIVEHSRADAKHPKYLNKMRQEILDIVKKYVNVEIDSIDTKIANQGGTEVLELNITLPEGSENSEYIKQKMNKQTANKQSANKQTQSANKQNIQKRKQPIKK